MARDVCSLIPNDTPTPFEEALLAQRREQRAEGIVDASVRRMVIADAIDVVDGEIERAKRARHTGNIVALVQAMEKLPRYRVLNMVGIEPSNVPF
ncbi:MULTISPECIES: hypothetical protein [unclassified Caballeronia]|uniref:hypothetical protein n=1 Tax=unclassified Caballeronia TaxID=2646786 RepID=UPI00202961A5|nr:MULTISPECIES: hypothetical protein [unclassified Caballeronia]